MKHTLRSISLLIAFLLPSLAFPAQGTEVWVHGMLRLENPDTSAATTIDLSAGIIHSRLFVRAFLRLEYENHFLFSDSLLLADFLQEYRKHGWYGGAVVGWRHFSMGYGWNRLLYGFNLGYFYRLTGHISLGAEYQWYAVEGGDLRESRLLLLPALRF